MKTLIRSFPSLTTGLAAVLVFIVGGADAHAQTKRKSPSSKLYVADVDGKAEINNGERTDDLQNKSVHSAEGAVIETKGDSKNTAVVLSNGTGVFFDPNTRLEMNRFTQEPFSPNRNDVEAEPSLSQTLGSIPHGTVGLCTPKMIAGSTMVYNTPYASVAIRGRKVVIQSNDNETVISLLEGDVTVRGDQISGGETLKPGQQAIIRRTSPNSPPNITIQPIPQDQRAGLDEKVEAACIARKKVYFESTESKTTGSVFEEPPPEIIPKEVVPPTIDPEITVSTATVPKPE